MTIAWSAGPRGRSVREGIGAAASLQRTFGMTSRSSLMKTWSLRDGSLDVVMTTFGLFTPAMAYSSSMEDCGPAEVSERGWGGRRAAAGRAHDWVFRHIVLRVRRVLQLPGVVAQLCRNRVSGWFAGAHAV